MLRNCSNFDSNWVGTGSNNLEGGLACWLARNESFFSLIDFHLLHTVVTTIRFRNPWPDKILTPQVFSFLLTGLDRHSAWVNNGDTLFQGFLLARGNTWNWKTWTKCKYCSLWECNLSITKKSQSVFVWNSGFFTYLFSLESHTQYFRVSYAVLGFNWGQCYARQERALTPVLSSALQYFQK